MAMNRTADEIIDAMEACVLGGGATAFLIGDNEMARLVEAWREMKLLCVNAELAFERGRAAGISELGAALTEQSHAS
jgi:hypothetical protein